MIERESLTPFRLEAHSNALPHLVGAELLLDGEVIDQARFELGYYFKGSEKRIESLSWEQASPVVGKIDGVSAVFYDWVYSEAIEAMLQISTPERALRIRVLLGEATRISNHLLFLMSFAKIIQHQTLFHYASRDRELILDLFEQISGSRCCANYICPGGVKHDISDGFLEALLEFCRIMRVRQTEYRDLFFDHINFQKRWQNVGVTSRELLVGHGVSGPNLRACGFQGDIRLESSYYDYAKSDLKSIYQREKMHFKGDVLSRVHVRLVEIEQSIELISKGAETIPGSIFRSVKVTNEKLKRKGEAYASIESSRGCLSCHIMASGEGSPERVSFNTPSINCFSVLSQTLKGEVLENFGAVTVSLDLSFAEIEK